VYYGGGDDDDDNDEDLDASPVDYCCRESRYLERQRPVSISVQFSRSNHESRAHPNNAHE
jgi:hypothetical protein